MEYPAAYLRGIELFNQAHFWHAHEEWEALWMAEQGPARRFVQGLIQTAAALVHWQRGNRRGLELNWAKARPKLAETPSPYWGLALETLIGHMDAMSAGLQNEAPALALY